MSGSIRIWLKTFFTHTQSIINNDDEIIKISSTKNSGFGLKVWFQILTLPLKQLLNPSGLSFYICKMKFILLV